MRASKPAGLFALVLASWKLRGLLRGGTPPGAEQGEGHDARATRLAATGAEGVATVLSVEDTGTTMSDDPLVTVRVRIEPADGAIAAFEAEGTLFVSRVKIPRPGDQVPVLYDPADPADWAFPVGTFGVTPPGRVRVLPRTSRGKAR
jgi:hypothetical protein